MTSLLVLFLTCAPNAGIDLTPEAWRDGITAARPGDHDTWLRRLHLPAVASKAWSPPTLVSVELLPAHLSGAKTPEVIARAIFVARLKAKREMLDPELRLYRVQVLQPDGAKWCALSSALSEDVTTELPNAGPADGMKDTRGETKLAVVSFSHPQRETIEVRKPFRNISRVRSEGEEVEWWDLVNGRLAMLLKKTAATYDCPVCDTVFSKTWFELRGPPPTVVVQFTRRCAEDGEKSCEPVREERSGPFWVTTH
jgi:hypothetical protein